MLISTHIFELLGFFALTNTKYYDLVFHRDCISISSSIFSSYSNQRSLLEHDGKILWVVVYFLEHIIKHILTTNYVTHNTEFIQIDKFFIVLVVNICFHITMKNVFSYLTFEKSSFNKVYQTLVQYFTLNKYYYNYLANQEILTTIKLNQANAGFLLFRSFISYFALDGGFMITRILGVIRSKSKEKYVKILLYRFLSMILSTLLFMLIFNSELRSKLIDLLGLKKKTLEFLASSFTTEKKKYFFFIGIYFIINYIP